MDFHFSPFAIQGFYEFRNVAIALALATPGDTIVEVGANVGTETVSFSDIVGPRGAVHAFEPLPTNAHWLRRAAAGSQYRNIILHECALGEANERALFAVPPARSSGTGHLVSNTETPGEAIHVQITTLDALLETIGAATLIFVDIEGHEVQFLRGARRFLTEQRSALVVEASPKLLRRAGTTSGELHTMLRAHGYVVYSIRRLSARLANPSIQHRAENWLCLPDERQAMIGRVNNFLLSCALLPCIRGINPLTKA